MKKLILIALVASGLTAFSQDSTNTFDYNYKKGIYYYNSGVDSVKKYLPEAQFPQCSKMPEQAMSQFKKALPYLEKAHSIDPKDENTLKALIGVTAATGENEKHDLYKKELESLKK